jgi:hypothetical protein
MPPWLANDLNRWGEGSLHCRSDLETHCSLQNCLAAHCYHFDIRFASIHRPLWVDTVEKVREALFGPPWAEMDFPDCRDRAHSAHAHPGSGISPENHSVRLPAEHTFR